uniref:RRM domain-containing protein n=1 Tax=Anopheles dirus TaxID=7168 RepID=A0A182N7G5_9DIPT
MSHSRNYNYYETSRSRSRERSYRREYRDDSDRYNPTTSESDHRSSRAPGDYSASGSYRRSSAHYRGSHYHDPHASSSSSMGAGAHECSTHGSSSGKVVLAVFNLSIYTTEAELYDTFSKFGPLRKTTVVLDAKTGRSRGFGFVYFESAEDAKVAHDQANGIEIGDRRIRVDFSATNKPHDPTPGVYYGKVSYPKGGGSYAGGHATHGYHHCRACEVEARDRERWERDTRSRDHHHHYYYDSYSGHERSSRDHHHQHHRSMMGRSGGRSDYYRGGTSIR